MAKHEVSEPMKTEPRTGELPDASEPAGPPPPLPPALLEATPSVRNMLTRLRAMQSHIQGRVLTRAANGGSQRDISDGNAEVMSLDWAIHTLLKVHGLPIPGVPVASEPAKG